MAVYKLFPLQDASMYSFYPYMNTGIDPIIEIGNLNVNINPVPQVFRYLIEFDQNEINSVVNTKIGATKAFNSVLKAYIANAQGVIFDTELEIYPISGSWNNGSGTYLDSPFTTNGVSWKARTFSGSGAGAINWLTDPAGLGTYVTASFSGSFQGGGNWFTGSSDTNNPNIEVTQSFALRSDKDLRADVSDIVNVWYSSSNGNIGGHTDIQNEGFIVKWENAIEFNTSDAIQPIMQFYSVDTNTIYPPVLEIQWDDQVFETGSLPPLQTADMFVALDNNPGVFYSESINRFRLNVRPDYPVRIFQTASIDTINHYLPDGSLWAIKDLDTNEFVVNFDDSYTKISCDSQSNYFDVYMTGLQPERYYKILIQTTVSGSTLVKDDNYYFKIVNG
jgi:hypothetical protein|tara:strand:- start:166 stop:1338 length:1173 start_codon:yes stop_codon:yes gene_type:complete